jgi:hypothetical protein
LFDSEDNQKDFLSSQSLIKNHQFHELTPATKTCETGYKPFYEGKELH